MVKCANCPNEALYTYRVPNHFNINYCGKHLPGFLAKRKDSALLALDVPRETEPEVKVSKKKTETVVTEPVVEETVVEEPVVEETPTEE